MGCFVIKNLLLADIVRFQESIDLGLRYVAGFSGMRGTCGYQNEKMGGV